MSRIIVGVPGPWEAPRDLMETLAQVHGTKYLFAGRVFLEMESSRHCEFEWEGHNDRMRSAFEASGLGRLSPATLDAVQAHRSVVYLVFGEAGLETARVAARFVRALLEAGGVAAKVESAGAAHSRERWLETEAADDAAGLYGIFVQLVGGDERYYSCGMHNFGLPDAAVPVSLDTAEAADLLHLFNSYQLIDSPTLKDGQTFAAAADAPLHRLTREPYPDNYPPDGALYNPHGLWALRPVERPSVKKALRWIFRS